MKPPGDAAAVDAAVAAAAGAKGDRRAGGPPALRCGDCSRDTAVKKSHKALRGPLRGPPKGPCDINGKKRAPYIWGYLGGAPGGPTFSKGDTRAGAPLGQRTLSGVPEVFTLRMIR